MTNRLKKDYGYYTICLSKYATVSANIFKVRIISLLAYGFCLVALQKT